MQRNGSEMVFRVYINTENEAFDNPAKLASETARILRDIAARVEQTGLNEYNNSIHDFNGNKVGFYSHKNLDAWKYTVCT